MKISNKYYIRIILLFIAFICFLSCSEAEDVILKNIRLSVNEGDIIHLADFTDFEWDSVIICNPGTVRRDLVRLIGEFNLNIDLKKLIIFMYEDNIVHMIIQDYHPEKYLLVDFRINTGIYAVYSKDISSFIVEKHLDYIFLVPIFEPDIIRR